MPSGGGGSGSSGVDALSWLNCFQLCKCLKRLGHVMVLAVVGLVGLSFYAVVVLTLVRVVRDFSKPAIVMLAAVLIALFSIVLFMLLWSYFATVLSDPGGVPEGWHPFEDEETAQRELQRWNMFGDTMYDRSDPRRPRYCRKCTGWKPERTHHCSVSGRCILKMDHYCIWVANCVGLLNYKFFLLFLMYTWGASLLSVGILAPDLVEYFKGNKESGSTIIFLAFVIDAAFVVSLLGFLGMHLKLLSLNCTSIEMYEKQRSNPWPYDKGWKRNVEEVFGMNHWLWPFPFHTEEEQQRLTDLVLSPRLIERTVSVGEDV